LDRHPETGGVFFAQKSTNHRWVDHPPCSPRTTGDWIMHHLWVDHPPHSPRTTGDWIMHHLWVVHPPHSPRTTSDRIMHRLWVVRTHSHLREAQRADNNKKAPAIASWSLN